MSIHRNENTPDATRARITQKGEGNQVAGQLLSQKFLSLHLCNTRTLFLFYVSVLI